MFCHHCGTQVGEGAGFCPNCGQAVGAAPALGASVPVIWTPPSGVQCQTGRWIGESWRLVTGDLVMFALVGLVFAFISGIPLLAGPMLAGFHIYIMKKVLGRPADFSDLFNGFNFFVPALVASIVIGVFTFAGSLLCIIPGLVVAAMYKFTYLFIVDKRMDFWPAMQASHAIVKQDYFGFTMFLLAMAGINILGALCCLIGLLVTLPMSIAAITIAYREIVGLEGQTAAAL